MNQHGRVAQASPSAGSGGVPPSVPGLRTETVREPAAGTAVLRPGSWTGKISPAVQASGAPEIKTVSFANRRLAREWKTIEAMIYCYCRDHHDTDDVLCPQCQQLYDYAAVRLERCRFGAKKPTCANCPVHCYQKVRREQVKVVMRYAGPRMLWQHPLLSLIHWLEGFRKAPKLA